MSKKAKAKEDREHKDILFRLLFGESDKSLTLSLYNAVNKSDYSNAEDIEITTLDDALYLNMKNDVSFLIAATMNFYSLSSSSGFLHQTSHQGHIGFYGLHLPV